MHSKVTVGFDDSDVAERAAIVAAVVAAEAAVAAAQAAAVRAFADAAAHAEQLTRSRPARDRDMVTRSLAAEIACAGRMSDRSVQRRIDDAHSLVTRYPQTMAAWAAGRIGQGHIRAVAEAGLPLDDADRALFDGAAVAVCEAETPAGARHLLVMLAEELNPRSLTERHQDARETRSVRVAPLADGMAELTVILPVTLARAIHDRLTRQARAVTDVRERTRADIAAAAADAATEDAAARDSSHRRLDRAEIVVSDERTMDQIRADVLADMLLTACPDNDPTATGDGPGELGAIRAQLQVTVPVLTLAGTADVTADLDGRSPIDADTARRLAAGAPGWDRVLTRPITGAVMSVDRYTPTAAMQRFLRARDQHCRFPGCRMPAARCDIDHTHDYARGGRTDVGNLAHLCTRHHTLKHAAPWTVRQLPGGVLCWTSPLGHTYTDHPPGAGTAGVRFEPDSDGTAGVVSLSDGSLSDRSLGDEPVDDGPPGDGSLGDGPAGDGPAGDGPPGVRVMPDGNPPPF
jgi:hypothetical protein